MEPGPEQFAEFQRRHARHNLAVNLADVSLHLGGASLISTVVVLPALLTRLGASNWLIALLAAVPTVCVALPQVFASFVIESRPRKKPVGVVFGLVQRLPWLVLAVLVPWLAGPHPLLLAWLIVALVAVSYMATGILSPAWGDLLAKAVPTDRWGAFWGWLTALGSGASVLGAAAVTGVLGADRLAFPGNYALLFWGATALTGVSYVFFLLNREPLQPVPPRPESLADYLRSLVAAVRGHRSFRNLLVANVLAATYNIGAGFFMVHAIRRFAVGDAAAGQFLMISTVVGAVAAPVLGRWADRWGHRLVLAAGRGLLAAALALALAAWRAEVLSAVFALAAVGGACGLVTGQNLLLKLAPPGQRPSYLGLASTVTTPFVIAFSVVGGWLADATGLGYRLPMALAAVCCGASVIVLVAGVRGPAVAEPPRAA